MPTGIEYAIVTLIIFIAGYFAGAWFQSHWWRLVDKKSEIALMELRRQIPSEQS
jgi:hypothetical protein